MYTSYPSSVFKDLIRKIYGPGISDSAGIEVCIK